MMDYGYTVIPFSDGRSTGKCLWAHEPTWQSCRTWGLQNTRKLWRMQWRRCECLMARLRCLQDCTSMHAEFQTEDCFIAIGSETIERFACDALCSEIFQLFWTSDTFVRVSVAEVLVSFELSLKFTEIANGVVMFAPSWYILFELAHYPNQLYQVQRLYRVLSCFWISSIRHLQWIHPWCLLLSS